LALAIATSAQAAPDGTSTKTKPETSAAKSKANTDSKAESSAAESSAAESSAAESSGSVGHKVLPRPTRRLTPSVIGLGPGFFFEDTDRNEDRFVNGQRDGSGEEREQRVSDGIFNLQAWVLFPVLLDRLRFGPGLAFYNSYTLIPPDDDDIDDNDRWVVGHTFHLFGQLEYVLPDVVASMNVLLGLRGGGIIVFAGRNLQQRLDALEGAEFDVWQTPRLGAFIGPHVGVMTPLNDKLAARLDFGIQFSKISLFDVEAEALGTLVETNSHLLTTRTMAVLGLEFGL
jgi:hypothetical protein